MDYKNIICKSIKKYIEQKVPIAKLDGILLKSDNVVIRDVWPDTSGMESQNEGITLLVSEGSYNYFKSPSIIKTNEYGEYLIYQGEYSLPISVNIFGSDTTKRTRLLEFINSIFFDIDTNILYIDAVDYIENTKIEISFPESDNPAIDNESNAFVSDREAIINIITRIGIYKTKKMGVMFPRIIIENTE